MGPEDTRRDANLTDSATRRFDEAVPPSFAASYRAIRYLIAPTATVYLREHAETGIHLARRLRDDAPGRWHHLTNRGLAKRTMFEGERDFRMFLAFVAKEVRAGRLEVHAFRLMLTHYHLLVHSPTGQLSVAMANVQREYSRWFNRSRKRDGPLVKDRFKSKVVHDLAYRCNVVTYIHDNPVAAKEVANPEDFLASSAWYWARR